VVLGLDVMRINDEVPPQTVVHGQVRKKLPRILRPDTGSECDLIQVNRLWPVGLAVVSVSSSDARDTTSQDRVKLPCFRLSRGGAKRQCSAYTLSIRQRERVDCGIARGQAEVSLRKTYSGIVVVILLAVALEAKVEAVCALLNSDGIRKAEDWILVTAGYGV